MINEKAVKLLQKYINEKYKKVELEDVSYDKDEFYYEFKMCIIFCRRWWN